MIYGKPHIARREVPEGYRLPHELPAYWLVYQSFASMCAFTPPIAETHTREEAYAAAKRAVARWVIEGTKR